VSILAQLASVIPYGVTLRFEYRTERKTQKPLWAWQARMKIVHITRMKSFAIVLAAVLLSTALPAVDKPIPTPEVYFSPGGGCTEAIVAALGHAKQTVFVQAYSFTSAPIAKALTEAHARGVKVQVILDRSQKTEKYSSADFVAHAGIPCLIDSKHAIAHSKIMIIDEKTVITGSFNFTKAAEQKNAENLLVIQDPALAVKYLANWREHEKHSESYLGR